MLAWAMLATIVAFWLAALLVISVSQVSGNPVTHA